MNPPNQAGDDPQGQEAPSDQADEFTEVGPLPEADDLTEVAGLPAADDLTEVADSVPFDAPLVPEESLPPEEPSDPWLHRAVEAQQPEDQADPEGPVEYERLDPQAVSLWRLQRIVRLATVGLPFAVAVGLGLGIFVHQAVGIAVGTAFVMMNLVSATVWPSLEYRAFGYAIRQHDLLVQSGVLFRHWSSIPLQRIQHVDTRQGPIERLLGLARLQVYTAAGMSADGSIPALDEARAEELRDLLSRRGGDDGV